MAMPDNGQDAPATTRMRRARTVLWIAGVLVWMFIAVVGSIAGVGTDVPIAMAVITFVLGWLSRGRSRWAMALIFLLCMSVSVVRWSAAPRTDRAWQPQLERQAVATLEGDVLTISDVRDFRWAPDGGFTPSWSSRSYDLAALRGVDLIVEPFIYSELMAHTMLSFDFGEQGRLVLSIEARKEIGEDYNPVLGGLNRYELIYLFLDERDAMGVRVRQGSRLHAYPLRNSDPVRLRAFLLSLCATANNLSSHPSFYKIVRDNCTTAWIQHADALVPDPLGLRYDTVLNGRIGRSLHDFGVIDTDLSYDDAKAHYRVDERVLPCMDEDDFSACVRPDVTH